MKLHALSALRNYSREMERYKGYPNLDIYNVNHELSKCQLRRCVQIKLYIERES